jgi:hypothetical protein
VNRSSNQTEHLVREHEKILAVLQMPPIPVFARQRKLPRRENKQVQAKIMQRAPSRKPQPAAPASAKTKSHPGL